MPSSVFIQPAGQLHRFGRPQPSFSLYNIVERPERLRAVNGGLAAAIARLEAAHPPTGAEKDTQGGADDLVAALEGLALGGSASSSTFLPRIILPAPTPGGLIRSKAVEFIHHPSSDDSQETRYLDSFVSWVKTCEDKWAAGESEIPSDLPQLDLYLCRQSLTAIEGALSTTIEAVDSVVGSSSASPPQPSTAFCAVRPPGHHCGEDNPMGFCFVNNVAVGAAHAYLKHDIDRVVILDIDLHHGNGTQEIVLRLNEDTYREELLVAGGKPPEAKRGLKIFYGSVHDIYSFPCEDGNLDRVKDASLNVAAHGQYIENIHILPYKSTADFWSRCYPRYLDLLNRSLHFLEDTQSKPEKTLILVSAGFDASEHEGAGMQRHGGNVPVGFYERFHRDTVKFALKHAQGRVVSVLEGGYGDRALLSGAMASLVGLSSLPEGSKQEQREEWWSVANLVKIDKALKRPSRRTTRPPAYSAEDAWLQRTSEIFNELEAPFQPSTTTSPAKSRTTAVRTTGERMMTRTRSEKVLFGSGTSTPGGVDPRVQAQVKVESAPTAVPPIDAPPPPPATTQSSPPISAIVAPVNTAPSPQPPLPPQPAAPIMPSSSLPPPPVPPPSQPVPPTFKKIILHPPAAPATSVDTPPPANPPPIASEAAAEVQRKIILKFRVPNAPPP